MTFADLYTRTLIPQRFRCANTWLVPMTLDHAEALDALGLWRPDDEESLRAAVFICSRSWRKAHAVMTGRLKNTRLCLWMMWRGNSKVTVEDWKAWAEYVMHHREQAVVTFKHKSDSQPGTPWLTHLRVVACSRLGYNPDTVGSVLLAKIVNEYHALSEMECAANVMQATRSELNRIAAAKKEDQCLS